MEKSLDDLSGSEDHGNKFDNNTKRKICFDDDNTSSNRVSENSDSSNEPTPTPGRNLIFPFVVMVMKHYNHEDDIRI